MVRAFKSPKNFDRPAPLCVRFLLLYILLLHLSWPSICWSYRSLLEYLFHPALSSTCCELQQTWWHCSGVIPSLMRPDCQLRAFNAKVTASSIIAPPPCPHSCPPILVLLFRMTGRVALDGVLLFPSMTSVHWGQDGPQRCLPAALGLPYSFSDVFSSLAWALGLILKWAGVPRSFGPTISPQNPAVRILGQGGGFWCPRTNSPACQVLSSVGV